MIKCQNITAGINWNTINTPDTLPRLLAKLLGNMKNKWNILPYNLRRQQNNAEFADLVTDSMFSRDALDSFMDKAQKSDHC